MAQTHAILGYMWLNFLSVRIVQLGGIAKGTIRFTAENTFLIEGLAEFPKPVELTAR
jgi:hypothetical protein